MIELETGRIGYVVLAFSGFLGIGDKLFAVPWSKLAVDSDNNRRATPRALTATTGPTWPTVASPMPIQT